MIFGGMKINPKSDLEIIRERGMAIINDLPNILDLRDRAGSLHLIAVEMFKNGNATFQEVKWGFILKDYDKILEIQREYIQKFINIKSDCNCDNRTGFGNTYAILPDGSHHISWCNQAKEFEREYEKLKEKYK